MRDRISAIEVGEFVRSAIEVRTETGRCALTMHEIVCHAWDVDSVKVPGNATRDYLRKVSAVRQSLAEDEGRTVSPIAIAYFRLIKGRQFNEYEASRCLPRRSAPQIGILFVDGESSPRDLLVWTQWVKQETVAGNSRGDEARTSVGNAVRQSIITGEISQRLLEPQEPLLAISSGAA